jgi:1,2-dihydroxy-3-keto-5-methylthiopentene dioxygenase
MKTMAILTLENGTNITELADISQELSSLRIKLNHWSVGNSPKIHQLLAEASLSDPEKEEVLQLLDGYFEQLKQDAGYQSRDLIVLNPDLPNLDVLLSKFNRCHIHRDDEVRYIIEGERVFGFVRPDGSQVELTVHPEEYINVPAGTEHWFYLTSKKRIKAVRYFTTTEGWTPEYTDTPIRFKLSK